LPHINIEYSANLSDETDVQALCDCLRTAAAGIDAFPLAGIRVRAQAAKHYSIADGNPDHSFVDISVRLRGGRTLEVRRAATEALFSAAKEHLAPLINRRALALSLEMRDIDPDLSPKTGNIREYIGEKS